jgi:hypothetical protein
MDNAACGQTLTQAPQSVQRSSTATVSSAAEIAPKGQDFWHRPQRLHIGWSIFSIY